MLVLSKVGNRLVEPTAITIDKYEDKTRSQTVYTVNGQDAAGIPHLLGRYGNFEQCQQVLEAIATEAEKKGETVIRLEGL